MLCVVLHSKSQGELEREIALANDLADMIELRLDLLDSFDLLTLRKKITKPVLVTPRQTSLERALQLQPSLIDFEHTVSLEEIRTCKRENPSLKIVRSYHNFEETPKNLEELYLSLKDPAVDIVKLCTQANSTLDALRMLLLQKKYPTLLGCCVGEKGGITRILSPIVNAPWTYTIVDQPLYPGQISIPDLLEIYSYRRLTSATQIFGLIGNPVSKSVGHITHNHLFQKNGWDAVYLKMEVEPDEVEEFLLLAEQLGIQGLSVTMPLKETVLPFVKRVPPEGAVNTLRFKPEGLQGINTDGLGAMRALKKHTTIQNKRVVILGAGGAARALAYHVMREGGQVVIVNRTEEKARLLAKSLGCHWQSRASDYDILINCIPLSLPLPEEDIISGSVVMEINTRPRESDLTVAARAKGCTIVYGYEMFVEQAVEQFRFWELESLNKKV